MSSIKGFDLLNDPLAGTNLLEASAGTGKTYTITGLFLRLVVEKRLPVSKILVVTFTDAATQELRDRIRKALRLALDALSGKTTADGFLAGMARKHSDSRTALRDLEEAIRAFDQAAIFTIHAFCRRVLRENAFESGSLFDTELISDQGEITREIVCDYWRRCFYDASPLFVHYVMARKVGIDSLSALLRNRITLPYLRVIPRVDAPDTSKEEQDFLNSFLDVQNCWDTARSEVERILTTDESLNRAKYGKTHIPQWIRRMDRAVASEGRSPFLFAGFEKFSKTAVEQGVKKGRQAPTHRFFDLCDRLVEKQKTLMARFDQCLLSLKAGLFAFAKSELVQRKKDRNIQSFDDLLLVLQRALRNKSGDALAQAIRAKFKAALIDEFQDTDPVQYAIFQRIFGTEQSILFLIGDPKQAIYGFRSADIFTYMEAADHVACRYTLDQNWRSAPDLICAVNALFSQAYHPFVYDRIPFQSATAGRTKDSETLKIDGKGDSPFHLWIASTSQGTGQGKPIPKIRARKAIASAVAGEIARLLILGKEGKALLGGRPIGAEDIAVLVRRNADARLMKDVLHKRNIPSVLYSTGNLFDTHEALEVERLLSSIADPSHEGFLKKALATDMFGVKGEELDLLLNEETRWEDRVVRFKGYHDLWRKKGFVQMVRRLLFDEKVIVRLMALPDGERRATNVLHLCEVLHQASVQKKTGVGGLVKWLAEQRDPKAPRLDEHQLRLESDERAVRLVTIHKSKGLEYPIVFCPFAWDGSKIKNKKQPFTFHDESAGMKLTLDMGSETMDRNRAWAEKEALAEELRLLYVALTRARNRCYLVWGRFNNAETSAQAYLLHQPSKQKFKDVARATAARFLDLSPEQIQADIGDIAKRAEGTIALSPMPDPGRELFNPEAEEAEALRCRTFSGTIDRSWKITSFSSLTSLGRRIADVTDRDRDTVPWSDGEMVAGEFADQGNVADIFAFPKGTKAGTFVHSIFEDLDFAEQDASHMENLVAEKLSNFGYESSWQGAICCMLRKVLAVPLDMGFGACNLSGITRKDRLTELEFTFPLKTISSDSLRSLLSEHTKAVHPGDWPERMGPLDFSPVRGFMRGFIDMVFQFQKRYYLVDWKTNFLGPIVEDYGPEALSSAMSKGFYGLQYFLYTVALHQYLRFRLPDYSYEKHFGGVYYLFVRGVDPQKDSRYGVFKDRPPARLIEGLCEELIGTED